MTILQALYGGLVFLAGWNLFTCALRLYLQRAERDVDFYQMPVDVFDRVDFLANVPCFFVIIILRQA